MAELVYAFDLKSNGENHMGSSPISGTIFVVNFFDNDRGLDRIQDDDGGDETDVGK